MSFFLNLFGLASPPPQRSDAPKTKIGPQAEPQPEPASAPPFTDATPAAADSAGPAENPAPHPPEDAEALSVADLLAHGQAAQKANDRQAALGWFERALLADPHDLRARIAVAVELTAKMHEGWRARAQAVDLV